MTGETIPFSLDGEPLEGRVGDTLAAAMIRAGVTTFTRSIKYHRPRGPFCFAGSCGQCLVRVDGVPSLPACRVPLAEGMACERQNAPLGSVEQDLFRAVDFLYPGGLDHHHLMIQSRLLGRVALEVARRLAGLGTLPEKPLLPQAGAAREVPLVIIGAGLAGLAAARGAIETGIAEMSLPKPLLLERDSRIGGAARLGLDAAFDVNSIAADYAEMSSRIELQTGAELIGLYNDPQPAGDALLAVRLRDQLLAVRARRVVIATGGTSQPHPFPGNDRPGVYAARGLLVLHEQTGVRVDEPGGKKTKAIAVIGAGDELIECSRALLARGYGIAAMVVLDNHSSPTSAAPLAGIPLLRGEAIRARGRSVEELQIKLSAAEGKSKIGTIRKIACSAVAIALPPAASHDLASSVGARAIFAADQSGFPLQVDAHGRTAVPWLFACGTATGLTQIRSLTDHEPGPTAREAAGRAGAQAAREAAALAAAQHASVETS